MKKGAIISPCGKYRYQLWRIWDESKPLVFWLMHNPSTADAEHDDPTIRRIVGFTKSWGYGGFYVGNLTPYRATDPKELKGLSARDLGIADNHRHIKRMKRRCKIFISAYGVPSMSVYAGSIIADNSKLSPWQYLKLTKSGYPCHPLYLKARLTPKRFRYEVQHFGTHSIYRLLTD